MQWRQSKYISKDCWTKRALAALDKVLLSLDKHMQYTGEQVTRLQKISDYLNARTLRKDR